MYDFLVLISSLILKSASYQILLDFFSNTKRTGDFHSTLTQYLHFYSGITSLNNTGLLHLFGGYKLSHDAIKYFAN